eukprot:PhM_4_TR15265/c0_g1_i1/m.19141
MDDKTRLFRGVPPPLHVDDAARMIMKLTPSEAKTLLQKAHKGRGPCHPAAALLLTREDIRVALAEHVAAAERLVFIRRMIKIRDSILSLVETGKTNNNEQHSLWQQISDVLDEHEGEGDDGDDGDHLLLMDRLLREDLSEAIVAFMEAHKCELSDIAYLKHHGAILTPPPPPPDEEHEQPTRLASSKLWLYVMKTFMSRHLGTPSRHHPQHTFILDVLQRLFDNTHVTMMRDDVVRVFSELVQEGILSGEIGGKGLPDLIRSYNDLAVLLGVVASSSSSCSPDDSDDDNESSAVKCISRALNEAVYPALEECALRDVVFDDVDDCDDDRYSLFLERLENAVEEVSCLAMPQVSSVVCAAVVSSALRMLFAAERANRGDDVPLTSEQEESRQRLYKALERMLPPVVAMRALRDVEAEFF